MKKGIGFFLLPVLTVFALSAQNDTLKPIGVDFFTQVKHIANLKVWEDKVFFTVRQANSEENSYSSDLYQLLDGQPVRIAKEVTDYFFLDGGLVFRRKEAHTEKKDRAADDTERESSTFLKLSYGFGEAEEWLSLPFRTGHVEWIAKDKFFYTSPYSHEQDKSKDYHIYEELPFWANGRGDVSGKRSHLYFYDKGESRLLTDTLASVSGIKLSPEKRTLVYTLKPAWYGKQPEGNVLVSIDVASLEKKEWRLFDKASYGHVAFLNEEEIVLTVNRSIEHDRIENAEIYRLNIRNGDFRLAYDGSHYAVGNSIASDIGGAGTQDITFDSEGIRFITTDADYAPLVHLSWQDAEITRLTAGRLTVQEYRPYKDGFLAVALEGQQGNEIYFIEKGGQALRLTDLNKSLFEGYTVVTPIEVKFINGAGEELNGYVLPPVNYESGRKYPAILDIHGGPKTAYGTTFFHEMQYWANQGYAVFFTNPRGSSGRGSVFSDVRGKVGKADYEDLMAFTDAVISQVDFVDADRLGVTGGSYGGLMTNWIIGQTSRFKAAASQRGISSWLTFSNTSDIGHTFTYSYWGSDIWKDGQRLWEASPLKYADAVTTPTLFIHSAEDYRCWLVEGLQMYYALQYFNTPARMVVFENENHELSRSGKPKNRIKRLEEMTEWFDKYLKDK
jgi:dipeptidyl aminopeptidase/acylaminoacyl peptidase